MSAKELTITGLVLNMLGVVLLFFFGFPQPDLSEEVSLGVGENTVCEDGTSVKGIQKAQRKKKLFYRIMSSIALLLMFAGFVLQAVGAAKQ